MKKLLALIMTVSGVLVLTGCAVEPVVLSQKQSELIASTWSYGEGTEEAKALRQPPDKWWAAWHDESLTYLVKATLENNTDIAQAQANLRAAQASLLSTTSALFPSASLGADASRNRRNHSSTDSFSADASAAWSFSFGGRDVSARRAAQASAHASELSLEDTKSAMTSEVALTYVNLRLAQIRLNIAKQSVRSYEEAKNLTQWRYQAGLVSATDYEQANAQFENAKANIATNMHNILQYETALSRLTVLPLQKIQDLPAGDIPTPPADLAVSIPADVISLRPDVLAAQETVRAAMENVRVAQADFLPTLSLSGSIGTAAATVGALGASGTGIGALVGALSMPFLNWGDVVAGTETQKATLDRAQAQYTETLVGALEETENALSGIRSSAAKKMSLRTATDSSQLAAQLALQQYSSGLEDYQTVLTTQRSWLTAQDNEVSNQADWAIAHIDLYRALGGGWVPEENRNKENKQ
ncbi:efflux transporter outer membrane subunit [Parasutterella secunda]|uniref:TolC family protein n=1 Tax=Parasutterella secunda TaxID=626947 RepID=A0ABS2GSC6_9BURK|nr:TolC family protein [Parasutterella secunda]